MWMRIWPNWFGKSALFALLCHIAANLLPLLRARDPQGNVALVWGWQMSAGAIWQSYEALFDSHPWDFTLLAVLSTGLAVALFPVGIGALAVGHRKESRISAILALSPFVVLLAAVIAERIAFSEGIVAYSDDFQRVWHFPAVYAWLMSYLLLAYAAVRLIGKLSSVRGIISPS
jgi:hypothetical protein